MGKKSLLAPTSGKASGSGETAEKEPNTQTVAGTAKESAPQSSKGKTSPGVAAKKKPGGSKAKKAVAKKASPKKEAKKSAPVKAVKKAAPEKAVEKSVPGKTITKAAPKKEAKKTAPKAAGKAIAKKKAPPLSGLSLEEELQTGRIAGGDLFPDVSSPAAIDDGHEPMDSSRKLMLSGAGVLAFLFLMILWASGANVGKYYVKPVDGHLEIWKGRFSPQGMEKIFILENTPVPDQIQEVLSREEAFSLIFAGVINNADALLNATQIPDFERIRETLESARPYAVSRAAAELLEKRLDKIDMMALVYKADILTAKGTVADLNSARESLERALSLNIDTAEKNLLKQKIAWIDQKLAQRSET
jgi:adenylate kinase